MSVEERSKDTFKYTPLMTAAKYGKLSVVKYLEEKGGDKNASEEVISIVICVSINLLINLGDMLTLCLLSTAGQNSALNRRSVRPSSCHRVSAQQRGQHQCR